MRAIGFRNPIDPAQPSVCAEVDVLMLPTGDGGLRQPLTLPTQSLVFRVLEAEGIMGFTGRIQADDATTLQPGDQRRCRVVFIGVAPAELRVGRRFALWVGRDVGSAELVAVDAPAAS